MNPLDIDGSYNTRASGTPGSPWLIRSAHLDDLSPAGERTLAGLGVTTVVDLRDRAETQQRRHTLPVVDVPIYDPATGAPVTGTLERVYASLLRDRGAALADAVRAIALAPGAVLVHCAAGKDRTGLVIALALEVAGVARATVIADYAASASAVRPARAAGALALLGRLDLDAESYADALRLHLDSPAEVMEFALAQVDAAGGAATYLQAHGLNDSAIETLRGRLGAHRSLAAR